MVKAINPKKRTWMLELRKAKGLKTREVAKILGVSFQHYNDIENGQRNPGLGLSYILANFFGVSADLFLKDRAKFKRGEQQ